MFTSHILIPLVSKQTRLHRSLLRRHASILIRLLSLHPSEPRTPTVHIEDLNIVSVQLRLGSSGSAAQAYRINRLQHRIPIDIHIHASPRLNTSIHHAVSCISESYLESAYCTDIKHWHLPRSSFWNATCWSPIASVISGNLSTDVSDGKT